MSRAGAFFHLADGVVVGRTGLTWRILRIGHEPSLSAARGTHAPRINLGFIIVKIG
jgi:hypothetical protein